jgi:hypothetical protein
VDGTPEGTNRTDIRPRPRWLVAVVVVFGGYLAFRVVEGAVWLLGQLR